LKGQKEGQRPLKDGDRSSGALEKEIMKHRCFKGFAGDESVAIEKMGINVKQN
jgi:hypothetical protein